MSRLQPQPKPADIETAVDTMWLSLCLWFAPWCYRRAIEEHPRLVLLASWRPLARINAERAESHSSFVAWLRTPEGGRVYGSSVPEMITRFEKLSNDSRKLEKEWSAWCDYARTEPLPVLRDPTRNGMRTYGMDTGHTDPGLTWSRQPVSLLPRKYWLPQWLKREEHEYARLIKYLRQCR